MGYRGEDVSATQGTWGRETPWHSSSDDYPAADGAGQGYRADGGYPEQGAGYDQGHGGGGYGRQEYGQQPEYGRQDYGQTYAAPGGGGYWLMHMH